MYGIIFNLQHLTCKICVKPAFLFFASPGREKYGVDFDLPK